MADAVDALVSKTLYRFFNVVLFILYFLVVIAVIWTGFSEYSNRKVTRARVKCKDGTSWNVTDIYWDDRALCGICTKRFLVADNKETRYVKCDYEDIDHSAFKIIYKEYAWSRKIVIYPLIVFVLGFGFVDFLKLAGIYIFSGRIAFKKSLLIKLLILIFASNSSKA